MGSRRVGQRGRGAEAYSSEQLGVPRAGRARHRGVFVSARQPTELGMAIASGDRTADESGIDCARRETGPGPLTPCSTSSPSRAKEGGEGAGPIGDGFGAAARTTRHAATARSRPTRCRRRCRHDHREWGVTCASSGLGWRRANRRRAREGVGRRLGVRPAVD